MLVLQTFMFAVFDDASENIQNATGPIDDGYIANAVGSLPGDPLCCAGPEPLDDGKPAALVLGPRNSPECLLRSLPHPLPVQFFGIFPTGGTIKEDKPHLLLWNTLQTLL